MFDIGWGELLVIGVVALIAIGPKELPAVLRTTGQWMGKIRRMASEFQDQFRDAMREAEMEDLKKKVDEMTDQASGLANFDPLDSVRKDVESLVSDEPAKSAADQAATSATPETAPPSAPVENDAAVPAQGTEPKAESTDMRKPGEGA